MKRTLLCVLLLLIYGCGGGSSPSQVTSFAGTWGYDSTGTKILATVVAPDATHGYSGTVQIDHAELVYDLLGNVIGTTSGGSARIYSAAPNSQSCTEANGRGTAAWGEGCQDVDAMSADMVLTPVNNSRIDCKIQHGFSGMSTATVMLTRR